VRQKKKTWTGKRGGNASRRSRSAAVVVCKDGEKQCSGEKKLSGREEKPDGERGVGVPNLYASLEIHMGDSWKHGHRLLSSQIQGFSAGKKKREGKEISGINLSYGRLGGAPWLGKA